MPGMMRYQLPHLRYLAGLLALFATPCVPAQTLTFSSGNSQVRILELYTSQGCSSCPPADAWLRQWRTRPEVWRSVIPVAFHVDYWDYLGWHDVYANAAYSDRQRVYQQLGHARSVYTPGFFLAGREWRGWFQGAALDPGVSIATGELTVTLQGDILEAAYFSVGDTATPLYLMVAALGFDLHASIARGENAGRQLQHDFVVMDLQRLAGRTHTGAWRWHGEMSTLAAPFAPVRGVAFWVAGGDDPTPLQATGGWLP